MLLTGSAIAATHEPVTINGDQSLADFVENHGNVGDGSYGSPYVIDGLTIDAHDAENGIVIENVDVYLTVQNCVVNNTQYVNSNTGSGDGIFISSCNHIFLLNNRVNETYDGITVLNSQNVVVYGNNVNNVTRAGIKIAASSLVEVYHNFCADSYYGIYSVQSTHASKFDNNTCLRGTYGFYVGGSYQNILSDNYVRGYTYGISIEAGSTLNHIDLNNCSSNSYAGIFLFDDSNSVTANKLYSNTGSGIQVNQADNCLLTNNLCIGNSEGIYATGANHVTLNGNNCSRNTHYGLHANGCQNITTNGNKMFLNGESGVFLNLCKTSYSWYDVISRSAHYGFFVTGSSWIYSTANCSYSGVSGYWIAQSDNCTIASANSSHNVQNGVDFENCHLCRAIDGTFVSNNIGIRVVDSDNSTISRVRAYQNLEGVELYGSDHGSISECHLNGNSFGIWVTDSSWAVASSNEISSSSTAGILMNGPLGPDNCTIAGNSISSPVGYGIQMTNGRDIQINGNGISNCNRNVMLSSSSRISVIDNTFQSGNFGIYAVDSDRCSFTSNGFSGILTDGIYSSESSELAITTNTFHNGPKDIYLDICDDSTLAGNLCDASTWGIYVWKGTGISISDGKCTDSTGGDDSIGIYLIGAEGTTIHNVNLTACHTGLVLDNAMSDVITNNVFYSNRGIGAALYSSHDNLLHHNQFIFNHGSVGTFDLSHYQAYDNSQGDNRWNTTGPDGIGNFWSDWCYPDIDRDGIVDAAFYIIGGESYDHYPIAESSAPTVSITSPGVDGAVFTTNSVTLSWDATDTWSGLDHYEVYMDNGPWLPVGFGNLQTWGSLLEGQHHLHVKAVDKASNEGTAVRTFYVDVSAPDASITVPGNHSALNDNTPTFSWTGTDAGTGIVHYNISLDLGGLIPVGSSSSYTPSTPLADGAHTFHLVASDGNGHARAYSVDFYVDTVAPNLESISPSAGGIVTTSDVTVTWTAFDLAISPSGLDRTEVRLDSGQWMNEGLGSTHHFIDVPEGFHTVYVKSFDKAGNTVEKNTRFMVDFIPPTISISSPTNHSICSVNAVTVTWNGSDEGSGIDHYEASVDNGAPVSQGTATSMTLTGLMDGSHNINIMAFDRSGKVRVAYVNVTIDTVAPMLTVTAPTEGGLYFIPDTNVTWTCMELGSGVASYDVKLDGGDWQARGISAYATFTLGEGSHMITVRATDMAGNNRSVMVNFTTDLNPPIIHSISPADGSLVNTTPVVFEWNVSDAIGIASIMYSVDSDSGHGLMGLSTSVPVTMAPGHHTFELTVTDLHGRQAIGSVNLTVDTVAPTIVAHTPANANAAVTDKISFRFSETVNTTGMSVQMNSQNVAFTLNGSNYEVDNALVGGTIYMIKVTGAKDPAGNVMDAFSWTFMAVSGQQSPGRFVVSGTMVDKNGQPVSGALVAIGGQNAVTNGQGQFSVYVDPGQQELHVTSIGMVEFVQGQNVTSDQQLGLLAMTSVADSTAANGSSNGFDMTPILILAMVAAIGLVIVVVVMRKRKG